MLQTDLFLEKSTKTRVRDACEAAREIAAMVEGMSARKASARQIVEAVRDYAGRLAVEARQERAVETVDQGDHAGPVWIASGSPEWRAWAAFYRATRGKTPPQDKAGGWRFPSRFPPSLQPAE
jgi:hypothetical protein